MVSISAPHDWLTLGPPMKGVNRRKKQWYLSITINLRALLKTCCAPVRYSYKVFSWFDWNNDILTGFPGEVDWRRLWVRQTWSGCSSAAGSSASCFRWNSSPEDTGCGSRTYSWNLLEIMSLSRSSTCDQYSRGTSVVDPTHIWNRNTT